MGLIMLTTTPASKKSFPGGSHVFVVSSELPAEKATCYVGYCPKPDETCFTTLFYPVVGVEREQNSRFVIACSGGVFWERLNLKEKRSPLKTVDNIFVKKRSNQNPIFGIFEGDSVSDGVLNKELTRTVFGFCHDELEDLTRSYALAFIEKHQDNFAELNMPMLRITSSYQEKICDINRGLIPARSPYITFNKAGYQWSTVSLLGFYTLLRFQMMAGVRSDLYQRLDKHISDKSILASLMDMPLHAGNGLFTKEC